MDHQQQQPRQNSMMDSKLFLAEELLAVSDRIDVEDDPI